MVAKFDGIKPKPLQAEPSVEHLSLHDRLCELGRRWAMRAPSSNGANMHLAFTEVGCQNQKENPDVFAIHSHGETVVLEAKASRSDFLADKRKPFRADPDQGMGDFRYYICPPDVIKPEDLEGTKWGLIYANVDRNQCKVIRGHVLNKNIHKRESNDRDWRFTKNLKAESDLQRSLLIRLGLGVDLNGLVNTLKVQSKYNGLLLRQDAHAQLVRNIERLDLIKTLKKITKDAKGSDNCLECIRRHANDMRRLDRMAKNMKRERDREAKNNV